MKIVYVMGFFTPVLDQLREIIPEEIKDGSVVWIPQHRSGQPDLNRFKGDFLRRVAEGMTEASICLFLFKDDVYSRASIDSVVAEGLSRSPGLTFSVTSFRSARDTTGIVAHIRAFAPDLMPSLPATLDEFENWAAQFYTGRLLIHPRAIRGAKKSRFLDAGLIYASISVLGTEYRNARLAKHGDQVAAQAALDSRLQELGVELSPSITETAAGREGKTYYVTYPLESNTEKLLNFHLTKGIARDERYCLRIYFFWDENCKLVVIGWLPSHLDTAAT